MDADGRASPREHGTIVCKPLDGMGGRSIFVVDQGDKNMHVIFETLTDYGAALRDRAALHARDRRPPATARVLLIDGEPVPYALARIPPPPTTAATSRPAPRASAAR